MMGDPRSANASAAPRKRAAADRLWTPANIVTLIRICLVPVFVVALISPWPAYFDLDVSPVVKMWVAAAIFIVLAATDGLDGYLARSRGEVTDFGKFMDPLADKILVAAALLSLIELRILPSWPALVILAREFIVSGIRMVAASKGTVIAASWYGKAKTVTQIIAIVLFIVKDTVVVIDPQGALRDPLYLISWAFMIAAVILTIVSMLDYLVKARHLLGFSSSAEDQAEQGASGLSPIDDPECRLVARQVIEDAASRGITLGTAESLTGGLIAGTLTAIPGSSSVVRGGIVSYVNEIKQGVLNVPQETLDAFGAVSEQTALSMAQGAAGRLACDISVSVTGIAGPGGAEPGKPVGTVWMGVRALDGKVSARELHFEGDRDSVRLQTVKAALLALKEELSPIERPL